MITVPPIRDLGEPEWRSTLLAEAIRHTAHLAGPITFDALHKHLANWLMQPEEKVGVEILTTALLMIRTGLYVSNGLNATTGEITFGAHTTLTPSRTLSLYLYCEVEGETHDEP